MCLCCGDGRRDALAQCCCRLFTSLPQPVLQGGKKKKKGMRLVLDNRPPSAVDLWREQVGCSGVLRCWWSTAYVLLLCCLHVVSVAMCTTRLPWLTPPAKLHRWTSPPCSSSTGRLVSARQPLNGGGQGHCRLFQLTAGAVLGWDCTDCRVPSCL